MSHYARRLAIGISSYSKNVTPGTPRLRSKGYTKILQYISSHKPCITGSKAEGEEYSICGPKCMYVHTYMLYTVKNRLYSHFCILALITVPRKKKEKGVNEYFVREGKTLPSFASDIVTTQDLGFQLI
jgi:predicted nucleic acid-binding Zn ribbon protein